MKIQNKKTKTITTALTTMLIGLVLMSPIHILSAGATENPACTITNSAPKGVAVDSSSNIWFNLDATHIAEMPGGLTSCSSLLTYSSADNIQNAGQFITVAGDGNIGYTQKGTSTGGSTYITGWNPSTKTSYGSYALTAKGFDDVDADPNNSDYVWVSMYYASEIAHYNLVTGSITTYTLPGTYCPAGTAQAPEGLRVDSSGNVWVADEACNSIDELNTSGFWSTYAMKSGETPWFVSVDNTDLNLYVTYYGNIITGNPGDVVYMGMNSGSFTTIGIPSGGAAQNPFGIDVNEANTRVAVAFAGTSYVNIYKYGSGSGWLCGSNGDQWSASGADPFGIRSVGTNYWVGLDGSSQIGSGSC